MSEEETDESEESERTNTGPRAVGEGRRSEELIREIETVQYRRTV